jgi:hypothetical protein
VRWLLKLTGLRAKLESIDALESGTNRYDRYGFRVPAVLVSPCAKKNWVASEQIENVFDHTSALKLAEMMCNLPALTHRDKDACCTRPHSNRTALSPAATASQRG